MPSALCFDSRPLVEPLDERGPPGRHRVEGCTYFPHGPKDEQMTTSTVARCTARSIASYEAVSDDLAVLAMTLWGTASRIAHGRSPNSRDLRALKESRYAIANQCQMLRYVQAHASHDPHAVEPVRSLPDSGNMLELAWEAAEAIGFDLPESIEGAERLVQSLERILEGDPQEADHMLPLFKRVALLAEQRAG